MHLSKGDYTPADDKMLWTLLGKTRINEQHTPSAADCDAFGGHFLARREYREAIAYYEKAWEPEKTAPSLKREAPWICLAVDLGTAYGNAGELKKVKELCEYALGKEPAYPMLHYNLACTCAELGDKKQALLALQKAFGFRANLLPGTHLPDPKKDPSFAKYMKDPKFVEGLEKMTK